MFKRLHFTDRLWVNIFLRVGVIFAAFVIMLVLANSTLLTHYFSMRQKSQLHDQLGRVERLDINDRDAVSDTLGEIRDNYNFDIEIYRANGQIIYTTHSGQLMDFAILGNPNFTMAHEGLVSVKSEQLSDGAVFEEAVRRFDNSEFLLCRKEILSGIYAEVRIQKQLISASADTASEFVCIMAVICFVLSIVWVFIFARKFSRPLILMNDITRDMSQQKFSRHLEIDRTDEIGQLAYSINEMSDSLSSALAELKSANAALKDEIELERQLDVMRRGFVANVSHELKTPIAIISGYAEGLKLNVNTASKEEYCDAIIDESARMNRLVFGLLQLSKYESGQVPLCRESFDISPLAHEITARIFRGKNISFECSIPTPTQVNADPTQIEQVLRAYLENAAAHTPDGGSVTVSSSEFDSHIRISVHNTGSHVESEKMSQIWQSFYRGDTSHKRDSTRFGLGLSIVGAIMRMHSRQCGVYNTETGVCFWFDIDRAISE